MFNKQSNGRLIIHIKSARYYITLALLVVIFVAVQTQTGQIISVISLLALLLLHFILNLKTKLEKSDAILIVLWVIIVMYYFRFSTFSDVEGIIEWSWLFVGLLFLILGVFLQFNSDNFKVYMLVCTSIICVLAILDYYGIAHFGALIALPYGRGRIMGGFDGPNEIGNFCVIVLAYILSNTLISKSKKQKLWWIISVPIVWVVILSWSRSALLVLGTIFVAVGFIKLKSSKFKRKVFLFVAYIIICCLCVFFIQRFLIPEFEEIRVSRGGRGYLMEYASIAFWKHPLIGSGLGSFSMTSGATNVTPHSEYLLFLCSGGIIGLLLLMTFFIKLLMRAYQKKLYPECFALICFFIIEGSFNNLVRGRVSILFWLIALFVLSTKRRSYEEKAYEADGKKYI